MSFPAIQFKATQVTVTDNQKELVEQKLHSLDKFIGQETDVRLEVEFERVAPHQTGAIFRIEVNRWVASKLHLAEATEESFERAINVVRSELKQELRQAHTKRDSLLKKGGRKLKNMLRFGE